jgi:hypothetical protein
MPKKCAKKCDEDDGPPGFEAACEVEVDLEMGTQAKAETEAEPTCGVPPPTAPPAV